MQWAADWDVHNDGFASRLRIRTAHLTAATDHVADVRQEHWAIAHHDVADPVPLKIEVSQDPLLVADEWANIARKVPPGPLGDAITVVDTKVSCGRELGRRRQQ